MPDFGVIGLGSVGWAVIHGLSDKFSYSGFDIVGKYDWKEILDTKIAFVCVGTPSDIDGRLDCTQVENVLLKLSKDNYKGVVIIKSTVRLGFFDFETSIFGNLRLVYMPEFLRERSSYTWFLHPDRFVYAGEEQDIEVVMEYFSEFSGVEKIITDFKTAELGKVAHNSFIATKVSFTNEIEAISKRFNADPAKVMQIVNSDRRVKSREHLTPGLGPYGGKCVPKDTDELRIASGSEFLNAVYSVNSRCNIPAFVADIPQIAVIVPTLCRMETLERALVSIKNQTLKPFKVIVVADSTNDKHTKVKELLNSLNMLNATLILNDKTQNLSGAVNSGLDFLESAGLDLDHLYIAFLDDDDWWDRKYLENCMKFAMETDAEWVISGIIRYDSNYPCGMKLSIPPKIEVSDFLVGNPNVQNSNLFILAKRILSINGFDEELESTTDRDVCIRLLQSHSVRYTVLRNHLVHHDARRELGRLSTPGSRIKRAGLEAFFKKYRSIMTEEQIIAFKERANTLFKVDLDKEC